MRFVVAQTLKKSEITWTLGRHLFRLFGGSEEHGLTGWAAAPHADALNMNNVLGVLIQIPQSTGARGGVHFLDEPQHAHILLLWMAGNPN